MLLNQLKQNEIGKIISVGGSGSLRQHFLDMGLIPGCEVTLIKFAPLGDPIEFQIHSYELTLRVEEASQIEIEKLDHKTEKTNTEKIIDLKHPGLGEDGIYHELQEEKNEPLEGKLTFVLAGNQNSGKTTLFNQLTGSNQHVGNFPGVTVEQKTGIIKDHPDCEIIDLPGIYSLSPYSEEELVSRRFILHEKPSAIINIVDATNIERNLYLTMQLMELDVPMVLALNMMDEVQGNGGSILINKMEDILQIPVVPISAVRNEGVHELMEHAIHIARYQEKPGRKDFCDKNDYNGSLHRCIHTIMHMIEDHAQNKEIPVRFAANKLIEGDKQLQDELDIHPKEMEAVKAVIAQMEEERGLDASAAIADMRYLFIERLCSQTVVKPKVSKERSRSEKIDKILTGKYTAIPVFAAIMLTIFYLTFNVIGAFFQDLLEQGIEVFAAAFEQLLSNLNINEALRSLLCDGVVNGVGSVLSFVPIIVILFFFLSLLEDSGYMTRIAFVIDKLLRKIGLSGRSIVPLLIGFGCSVPAIMATRTLPSRRDRKMTIMLVPFMSCSAKMPIYYFFVQTFFPDRSWLIISSLYFLGILTAIIVALIGKNTVFKGEAVPFVMELPNYRMPSPQNVLRLMWDKAKDFLQRAFTIIFTGTVVIWILEHFSFTLNMVSDPADSILAYVASLISPIFKPLGFGDWKVSTALISGFLAKESVVSTLSVLYGSPEILRASLSTPATYALLTFCLLYTPCVAAVAAVRREEGVKGSIELVVFQCVIAWIVAFIMKVILTILGI
ncbi:MAG: ferrous iron transport protein B [Erysipelotrichaceae bacterium]|nr:ferrous iron transport protein B [Erysipelotrichaceae bacterium]